MANMTNVDNDTAAKISAHKKITQTTGEKVFMIVNYIVFAIIGLIVMYPFWHEVMLSFSSVQAAATGGVFLLPREFTLNTYQSVLRNKDIWSGFTVSITVTLVGTLVGTLLTATVAYPLSKTTLRGSSVLMFLVVFTMLFNGGMIPNYLLIRNLGIQDTLWALILPNLVGAYNVIIMRSFFASLPPSLEESAKIDGANDILIFIRIILPLSMATVATIGLFTAVMYWNDFFSTVLYINTRTKWSLQANLRYMLTNTSQAMKESGVEVAASSAVSEDTIKAASIVVSTVPILIVYPFLQKYFVKGVMVGSIKG